MCIVWSLDVRMRARRIIVVDVRVDNIAAQIRRRHLKGEHLRDLPQRRATCRSRSRLLGGLLLLLLLFPLSCRLATARGA